MFIPFKKIIFTLIFNLSLFLLLMIGIQNSKNYKKVNFLIGETISLPISFIIGVSFISGSIAAGGFPINFDQENE